MSDPDLPVDVVVLSWNRLDTTLETIANIETQQDVAAKIWIVDQGSEADCVQGLRQVAARSDAIHLEELDHNIGVAGGRNLAMSLGNAEYIVAIDNDAEFASPKALSEAAARLRAAPELGVIGFRIVNFYTGELDRLSWVYPRSLLDRNKEEFLATRFCGAGHAIRRSALERTAGYDEALFFFWEELDLCYQMIEQRYQIAYVPSIEVRHKVDPGQRTNWSGERFYYLVRNALYLDWKYYRSKARFAAMASGYQVKAARNRVSAQAVRGTRDALAMISSLKADTKPLGPEARKYIEDNDLYYRGSIVERIRREVLDRLPGSA